MNKHIQVTRSSLPKFEEYMEEIRVIWDSHWLTNMGIKHKQLEDELKKYLDVSNINLFTNGHLALEYAIAAFDLKGEVVTTPFTFASTTHAIVRNELEPIFCDINFSDYTIDVDKIEDFITEKTSAIIPVHVYGNACNVDAIENIARKYNLRVIYDAAHAFGVTINDIGIGNFGDASMFSFHATKVFNTIEGGAITFKNKELRKKLNILKNFGITGPESIEYIGGNAKMNEFQAAMGICNLRYVDEEIRNRKMIVDRYISNLESIKGITILEPQNNVKSNFSYFPILLDGYRNSRDEIFEMLRKQNIIARKYFYPLTNCFECYSGRFNPEDTPVAKYVAERVLTLPLYADLDFEDVDKICEIIK